MYFDSTLEQNRYYGRSRPQVGATWAEKLSPIGPEWPRSGKLEGSGQSSLAGRFGLAVELWELLGNGRNPAQTQVEARLKVYLTDKTYD